MHFQKSGRADATIYFTAGRKLSYSIERHQNAPEVFASFEGDAVRVVIPAQVANRWTDTDDVGIQASQPIGDDLRLELLIEKDFQCLNRTADQEPDGYRNPLAAVNT
jgi:hypothetical protein